MSYLAKKNLHQLFCESRGCREDRFVRVVFWQSLHLHAVMLLPLLSIFSRRYFEPDLDLIRAVGGAATLHQVNDEIRHYITDYRNQTWMRRSFHMRLSTHKLRRIAYEFLPRHAEDAVKPRAMPKKTLPPRGVIQRRAS